MARGPSARTRKNNANHRAHVPADALRWVCDPAGLPFNTTDEVEPVPGIIGQDSAVDSLQFGLATSAAGQNIFVRGLTGTGRLTLVHRLLKEIRPFCPETTDRCYVHNFAQPDQPRLITLPAGSGSAFRRRVDRLADFVRDNLRTALTSESINARRTALKQVAEAKLKEIIEPFQNALKDAGLAVVNIEAGPVVQAVIFPVHEERPIPPEEFEELRRQGQISEEEHRKAREAFERFEPELPDLSEKTNAVRREHEEKVADLLEKAARQVLGRIEREIKREFPQKEVADFLGEMIDEVVKHRLVPSEDEDDYTRLYRVNVLCERGGEGRCPIIVENAATVRSLLGTIDFDYTPGNEPRASHMGIRAGSILRADGGYLILEDQDILSEPGAWKALVRVLRTGQLEIMPPDHPMLGWVPTLRPEPIAVNIKVVLLGDPDTYYLLDAVDPNFPRLFKVLADFDNVIPRDAQGISHYAAVLARIVREEKLPPFDRSAIAALAEHGARIASHQKKLTARFGRLADIAREAAFVAVQQGHNPVTGDDVRSAVRRGKCRADLPARKFREYIAEGTIRVETRGEVVGQINGLAVIQAGPMTYGFPTRITATIGPGSAGVINIERESALSGAIHTKGFYILGGLLRYLLPTEHPLAFDASVAFEQSYGAIDGDSASGAEICCLLSALTGIPIRQDLAMTGAIDQMGHLLAIGAVNEKIEGFFDACHQLGLTGSQGVLFPATNAGELMLREDVIEACGAGRFAVYAVETIHQALEILTGVSPGERNDRDAYPPDSILGIAMHKARDCWIKASQVASPRRRAISGGVLSRAAADRRRKTARRKRSARRSSRPGSRG
jgi:predicted ATP-dependent protease